MALGSRLVADLMLEISMHLIEPPTVCQLAEPVVAGPSQTITLLPSTTASLPASPLPPTATLYPGAELVLGWQSATPEVITVLTVDPTPNSRTFTADVSTPHAAGATLFGATFPTQQPTDPIFTQSEILGYIAQAQNEFLTRIPLILQFFNSELVETGAAYQTIPATAIELERIASQSNPTDYQFPISSIRRVGNVVTASCTSTSADSWTPALPIQVFSVADPSFDSATLSTLTASNSTFPLTSVSADGATLTWSQAGPDAVSAGGYASRPIYTRLYESSQEQLAMNDPWWQSQQGQPPTRWAEDRAGAYGYVLAPPPAGNFYMNLLASTRADTTLTLLSPFAVPDIFVYAIKWRALAYCWGKDGVQRSATMQKFAEGKFAFYCMLADRFLRANGASTANVSALASFSQASYAAGMKG